MNFSANSSFNPSNCRFPPFCSLNAIRNCSNIPLRDCSSCSVGIGAIIVAIFIIIGLLTVLGNFLVFLVTLNSSKKDRTKLDYIRVSLAAADIIKGLDLLVVSVPHALRSLDRTASEILSDVAKSQNSTLATTGGVFVLLIYTSSLFHLLYMSGQRFVAVRFPFKYRNLKVGHVVWHLVSIWALSLVASSIPAWSSGNFVFGYNSEIFQYFISFQSGVEVTVLIPVTLLVLVPYLAMSALTIATTHIARRQMHRSKRLRGHSRTTDREKKAERLVLTLTKSMVLGYTISILPIAVMMFLEYFGKIPCTSASVSSFIVFYLSTSSGLADVLTYSFYDPNFRKQVCYHFNQVCIKRCRSSKNFNLGNRALTTPITSRNSNIQLATVTHQTHQQTA